ncbi:hypothetical protein I4U23_005632, partial [Adineta vaga]
MHQDIEYQLLRIGLFNNEINDRRIRLLCKDDPFGLKFLGTSDLSEIYFWKVAITWSRCELGVGGWVRVLVGVGVGVGVGGWVWGVGEGVGGCG